MVSLSCLLTLPCIVVCATWFLVFACSLLIACFYSEWIPALGRLDWTFEFASLVPWVL